MMRTALVLAMAACAFAQPKLQNAKLETRAVNGSLESTVRALVSAQSEPIWIAYAADIVPGDRTMCCWNSYSNSNVQCQGCTLEPQVAETVTNFPPPSGPVMLEGAPQFFVFLRVENRQIEKIRTFSMDCAIDAGGLPFYWLNGVEATQSIAFLRSMIPTTEPLAKKNLTNSALQAIYLHRDGIPALIDVARHGPTTQAKKQSMQFIGQSKDPRATRFLEDVLTR